MRRAKTETIIAAMRILAEDIHSEDGVANAAIREAADRLQELAAEGDMRCVWTLDSGSVYQETYDGGCGVKWGFGHVSIGRPIANFCPQCGRRVKVKRL